MMSEAAAVQGDRMAAQGRVLENSKTFRPCAVRICECQARGADRVSASFLFQGAPVCPLDAPEFGR